MRTFGVVCLFLSACVGTIDSADDPLAPLPQAPDAPAPSPPDGPPPVVPEEGIAPPGAIPGEVALADGDTAIAVSAVEPATFRVDADAEEHVAVSLWFTGQEDVVLAASRWDGLQPEELAQSNAGEGKRFLSVLDADGRRTYWFRVTAGAALTGTLRLVRTPFSDGPRCASDCARLLQMPLPNDPLRDGYDVDSGTIFRYWFGRRDLVMFTRHAARNRALAGKAPFYPYDFSQWDGMTPGVDVGSPRHVSHQRGKDVDISLYGSDGNAWWRSFCTVTYTDAGRECVDGTVTGFDAYESAREIAGFFDSGRVTMSFLDRELIEKTAPAAVRAAQDGLIDPAHVSLYSDGKHVQHWPNHNNHIHVRVSEATYGTRIDDEPFEAP